MWFEILRDFTDYRDYMGLSVVVRLCKWSLLGLISYNLVGSVTKQVRTRRRQRNRNQRRQIIKEGWTDYEGEVVRSKDIQLEQNCPEET